MSPKPCTVTGCTLKLLAKGLCAKHYSQVLRWGSVGARPGYSPTRTASTRNSVCKQDGCTRKASKLTYEYCTQHYRRQRHLGLIDALRTRCKNSECQFFCVFDSTGLCTNCQQLKSITPSKRELKKLKQRERYRKLPAEAKALRTVNSRLRARKTGYYQTEAYKQKKRKYMQTEGRGGYIARCALRRTNKLKATPSWVSKEDLKEMYKSCPKGSHVDHIIPLKHKDVCGLHVPWNLQIISKSENCSKQNQFDGTYENETWRRELQNEIRQKQTGSNDKGTEAQTSGSSTREEAQRQATP